jgi:hypothetical protein
MSRPLLAAALAVLVLTSGCSFLSGGGTPTSDGATPTPTPTDSPTASPTATPSPTPTPTPSQSFPAGYGADGVTDAGAAISGHADALVGHDSFIVTIDGTIATQDGTRQLRQLQSVNRSSDRGLIAVNGTSGIERTSYFDNGTRYLQVDPPGENNTRYNVTDATIEPRGFTGAAFLAPVLTNVTYGEVNVTENANGTFYSYSAASVNRSAFPVLFGPSVDPNNVTRFEAGVVVDEEGIVRRMNYRAVVERGNESFLVEIELQAYSIDEVSISAPPWLDEAQQADGSS